MYSKRFKVIFSFLLCVVLIICYWKRCNRCLSLNHSRLQFYLGKFEKGARKNDLNTEGACVEGGTFVGQGITKEYQKPLKRLLRACGLQHKCYHFVQGDNCNTQTMNVLARSRTWDDTKTTLLRCLQKERHWFNYYNRPPDVPFKKKKKSIIWRGATTSVNDKHNPCFRVANRFTCVTKWFNKHRHIDVGFSSVSQGKNEYERFVKGNMSINKMLGYKYILSIEGNDKDSGLNWKLNSNSLIFMAKPTIVSWLMESLLIPNFHYILVDNDFGDLAERLEWCERNPSLCQQIIKNANDFMKVFQDQNSEVWLEKHVVTAYINNVN
jgi:hypothetical protein